MWVHRSNPPANVLCIPALGLFATSSMILSELLRESLLLASSIFVIGGLICLIVFSLLNRHCVDVGRADSSANSTIAESKPSHGVVIVVVMLAVVVNLFPNFHVASITSRNLIASFGDLNENTIGSFCRSLFVQGLLWAR